MATNLDFDAIYRGSPALDGAEEVPWNIGEPQPALADLLVDGRLRSPVLDAGCGVGVTSRALARAGHEVVGVDASPAAIDEARRRSADEGLTVEFAVADLTGLRGHDGRFATVVDSAVFHAVDAERLPDYVRALARACRAGAELHVLVFADVPGQPDAMRTANPLTEVELRDLVSPEFVVDDVHAATIAAVLPPHLAPSCPRDDADRALLPAWRLRAHRP